MTKPTRTMRFSDLAFGWDIFRDDFTAGTVQKWLDDLQDPKKLEEADEEDRKFIQGIDKSIMNTIKELFDTDEKCQTMWDMYADVEWSNDYKHLKEEEKAIAALAEDKKRLEALSELFLEQCGQQYSNLVTMGERQKVADTAGRASLFMDLDKPLPAAKVA